MKNGENEKTAEDMQQDSIVVSEKFLYLGVKRADTITICMPDCYEAAVCALAADKIGATVTYVDSTLPPNEVRQHLKQFHSLLLINYEKSMADNAELIRTTNTKYVLTLKPKNTIAQMQEEKIPYGNLFMSSVLSDNRGQACTVEEIKQQFFCERND
ncbi:MAG: AMP-binding protein [Lachnospiraceae bacterium]|nr:AMP-binding protein [Lachnospiraceae bacterium]